MKTLDEDVVSLVLTPREAMILNSVHGWLLLDNREEAILEAKQLRFEIHRVLVSAYQKSFAEHRSKNMWEEAEFSAANLCAFNPLSCSSWMFRAEIVNQLHGKDKARDALVEGVRITHDPWVGYYLAKVLLDFGFMNDAREALADAVNNDKHNRLDLRRKIKKDSALRFLQFGF